MANDVSAPLPQVDLLHGSVLTVTLDVAGATITGMNVHGVQVVPTTGSGVEGIVESPWAVPVEA